jgi:hypothetical protein
MLAAIRAFNSIALFVRLLWRPATGLAFFIGMTLLRCDHAATHRTEKRIVDNYPRQMQALRNWRMKP